MSGVFILSTVFSIAQYRSSLTKYMHTSGIEDNFFIKASTCS